MDYQEFIKPELLVLIPVLLCVGAGIKKSNIQDTSIPLILGAVGVLLAGLYVFATDPVNGSQAVATAVFTAFTQGVLCAGASVYAHQIYKQATKAGKEDELNG
ncbi:MAG: phage holin family protein [Selenomonadaceae bacterium]|nr:phage holin family protein [Selenomonadaceae bacterium]